MTVIFDKPGELYCVKKDFGLWNPKYRYNVIFRTGDIFMFIGIITTRPNFLIKNEIAVDLTCTDNKIYVDFVRKCHD